MSVFRSKVYIQYLRSLFWFLLTILSASLPNAAFIRNLSIPSKHFNIFSTLFLSWYDFATSYNIKSTLKQRCVRQLWDLQRRINFVYFVYFDLSNVRQRRNNVIFNVDLHNVEPRRTNVVNMIIKKDEKINFESIT